MGRLLRYSHQSSEVLKSLMYRIALNLLTDSRRRSSNFVIVRDLDFDAVEGESKSENPSPDECAQQQQELALARRAILRLPDYCKQIYLLNRMDGLTYAQIANRFGVSVKAIEKQMSKALALVNREMTNHGADRKGK